MKSFFALAALAASALAQNINIGAPADLSTVSPGSEINVMVVRPNTLTGSVEIAVVIGMWPCAGADGHGTCAEQDVSDILGNVLYNGPFHPQYQEGAQGLPPHQNFTVTVPQHFTSQASLAVAHFAIVGASSSPFYEFRNVTLVLQ
ncbi:hypothetical protein C8Q80DRAFT_1093760 [Daedaleopsis nitida]|nr:hypothetical protein C8Q80DRAFT_1093760 [Daedaleopsis nitida]